MNIKSGSSLLFFAAALSCSSRTNEPLPPITHDLVDTLSLCRIAKISHALAEVQIEGWGKLQQLNIAGYIAGEATFTPLSVHVRDVLWGSLDLGKQTILVEGPIDASGRSPLLNGTYRVDDKYTAGFMFVMRIEGRYVQATQGYFWRSGEAARNDAQYTAGIDAQSLSHAETYVNSPDPCPEMQPQGSPADAGTLTGDAGTTAVIVR